MPVTLRLLVETRVAQKEPDLLADVVERAEILRGEAAADRPPHQVEATDHLVVDDQRQEEPRLVRNAPEHPVRESLVLRDVVRVHGTPLRPQGEDEALVLERQRSRGERRQVFLGHAPRGGRHKLTGSELM